MLPPKVTEEEVESGVWGKDDTDGLWGKKRTRPLYTLLFEAQYIHVESSRLSNDGNQFST